MLGGCTPKEYRDPQVSKNLMGIKAIEACAKVVLSKCC